MSSDAVDEQIDVRNPGSNSNQVLASVILRPVQLERLADLVSPTKANYLASARQQYAKELSLLGLRLNGPRQEPVAQRKLP
jgi:hypothetical protein